MPRAKALVLRVEDRPGMLAEITSVLGAKGVNLRAVHASNEGGQGLVRMVVDKTGAAKRALAARGWTADEEEILEIELADKPGALGVVAGRLGDAGVNISHVFVSTSGGRKARAFLGVSDLKAALKAVR
jgi:hypothetical protein